MMTRTLRRLLMTGLMTMGPFAVFAQEPVQPEPASAPETTVTDAGLAVMDDFAHNASDRFAGWLQGALGDWGGYRILGLEAWRYVALLVLLLATFALARFARWVVKQQAAKLAAKTKAHLDDMVVSAASEPLGLFITALGLCGALYPVLVVFPSGFRTVVVRLFMALAAGAVLWYAYRLVDVADHYMRKMADRTDNDLDDAFVDVVRKTLRVFVVVVGVMLIGQTILKLNIGALIASAGIAGLAIAFAAQDTIANIFGSFMVLLDRPFKVGERIKIEGADGSVEGIGFRSTRIRTLDGHQVSMPNKTVANSKIENIGRRPHIKRVGNLTITYDTPVAKVEKALQIVRGVLADHEGMDPEFPPRVHFTEFNDWSLNILFIAWYHPADYWNYLQWCENVNLQIMREFEAEGIEFAFPTSTTYLANDSDRELNLHLDQRSAQPEK